MKRALFVQPFLGLVLVCSGCASVGSGDSAAAPKAQATADDGADTSKLEHQVEIKRDRLAVAQMEAEVFEASHQRRMEFASEELSLAKTQLGIFKDFDLPNRIERSELALRASKDRAQEAADELKQIEIMYDEQDLADETAEFVVARGRRRAERAQAQIAIEEREHEKLVKRELPAEQAKLVLSVEKAREALESTKRDGELAAQNKAIAIKESKRALEDAETELADAKSGADQ